LRFADCGLARLNPFATDTASKRWLKDAAAASRLEQFVWRLLRIETDADRITDTY
jgi:hypothetical protein